MARSEFTYIPLRNLFFSLLNENSKTSFKDAISSLPERLVNTSVFCNDFWKTLSAAKSASLTAEQAWFGIRSILKGTIGTEGRTTFQLTDFKQLIPIMENRVKSIIAYGDAGLEIKNQLDGNFMVAFSEDFEDALITANNNSTAGDTILLSPACASFDQFANFEERGQYFKTKVMEMMAA